ncbi:hypothetical protein ACWEH1_33835 [Micromonospora chersina]
MRTVNRVATLLLAVALLAGGVLVAVAGLLAALGRPGPLPAGWSATLSAVRWRDAPVRTVAATVTLLGLLLLVAELRRWRPARLRLTAALFKSLTVLSTTIFIIIVISYFYLSYFKSNI